MSDMLAIPLPIVRRVAHDSPWEWLQRGWRDLARIPLISTAYGAAVTVAGFLLAFLLWEINAVYLVLPIAGGFMLAGPFLAVGLYDASRRLEAGEAVSFPAILLAWRRPLQIGLFGILLLLVHFAWIRTAMLWFVLYFHEGTPPLDRLPLYLLEPGNLPFLVIGTAMGAGFALITFTVSAVSLPLLVDRNIDLISAILISIQAVLLNPKAMLLWAGLIALFTAVGLATFFVGLVLLFPLVGYATWHAYRDLVG